MPARQAGAWQPVAPSPETGDFTGRPAASRKRLANPTTSIRSARRIFPELGRDAQAEEILKEALKTTPNNHQIHLKLLGIYSNRKDANSFSAIARELKDSGDEYAWQEAVAMGRELEPGNPLYGGAGSADGAASSAPSQPVASVDFDLDLGALSGKAAPSPEQDFLGDPNKTVIMSHGDLAAAQQPSAMDFDVTAASPSAPEAGEPAAPNLDELIFDVTGSHPAMPAAQMEASKPAAAKADDGAMEFTIDFPVKETAVKSSPAAQAAEAGLAGISLSLDETPAPGGLPAEGKDDHWQEVATKLDLARAYHKWATRMECVRYSRKF